VSHLDRRSLVKLALAASPTTALVSCGALSPPQLGRRVLAIAFDGMHPEIVANLMAQGRLPNFQRVASAGSFQKLQTSMPPHTPVAFSNIISGADAGTHQIFDFIHRDPVPAGDGLAVTPYFSTARAEQPEHQWAIPLGGWELPLSGGSTELMRRGPAFWDALIAAGIDTDVYYLPSNYPTPAPEGPGRFRAIGGMGTPDVTGSYGEFTSLTFNAPPRGRHVDGGRFLRLSMFGDRGSAELAGPTNHLCRPEPGRPRNRMKLGIKVLRDPSRKVAQVTVSGHSVILNQAEWSDWIPVRFSTGIPGTNVLGAIGAPTTVAGMVRMLLKQVHPHVELYISPVNIDPLHPAVPISTPSQFASELAMQHGRFYTTGIPEDTKALSHGALNEDQFLGQSELAHEERVRQFRAALTDFRRGCMFFYFGTTDLLQHMFWRDRDPAHPAHDAVAAAEYGRVVEETYQRLDALVGEAIDQLDDQDRLLVLSDHGFDSFRRGFNLNSWLVENDFIKLIRAEKQGSAKQGPYQHQQDKLFSNVDWAQSAAYGLGMNGLYLNQAGREKNGIVRTRDRAKILRELSERLLEVRDQDGSQVIDRIALVEDLYPGADPLIAPDIFIGYRKGYRASWETVLGNMPREQIVDNLDRWSGTHLINPDHVPGLLLTNFPVAESAPDLCDIAPTILHAFGIDTPAHMTGRPLQLSPSMAGPNRI